MLLFPQLLSGTLAQSVRRMRRRRIAEVERPDGTRSQLLDLRADSTYWTLKLDNISIDEWQSIESLFVGSRGRLKAFLFIDPLGNMLSHSDDLLDNVWARGPYLDVSSGQGDYWGGLSGSLVVNAGQEEGDLEQSIPVPGSLQYTMSVYLRTAGSTNVDLWIASAGAERRANVAVTADWRRYSVTAALDVTSESCRFGLTLPAGRSVECCGFQAEAQPFPSMYKRTTSGAVYPATRFDTDVLPVEATSPGCYSTTLQLMSRTN